VIDLDPTIQKQSGTLPPTQGTRAPLLRFAVFLVALTGLFSLPLLGLARLAADDNLYSHVVLIPFISAYLVWLNRKALPSSFGGPSRLAAVPATLGLLLLLSALIYQPTALNPERLSITISAYVLFIWAGALFCFGTAFVRSIAFPTLFLVFLVPFPPVFEHWLEVFFQHTSADAAAGLFQLSGLPTLRDGLTFRLPGMTIQVAEECSGIRSSLVLFISSLVAGYMFLRSPWRRTALALAVIPLGIIRNGFRIIVIGWLCVEQGPHMIDSAIHRRGGPIFFLLSLIPLFLLLCFLIRSERKRKSSA
jgi:exosortase C (VPDSG-CTERM-specific)